MEDPVEKQIREAIARGDFDNLPGKGKPLNLDENPHEPEDMRMAHRIMKNNDVAPYWIELSGEIEREREELESDLAKHAREVDKSANIRLRERVEALNKKIFEFNLRAPLPGLHKKPLKMVE